MKIGMKQKKNEDERRRTKTKKKRKKELPFMIMPHVCFSIFFLIINIIFGFCGEKETVFVCVCVCVCLKLIFSEVLYHNGKSNLRHFFSCFLCYNYVMVPFFFFSLPSPSFSPSSGPPHFIIEFVHPSCWLIVFLLASFLET